MPSKKWYKSVDGEFLERSRIALGEYLQVTSDEIISVKSFTFSTLLF